MNQDDYSMHQDAIFIYTALSTTSSITKLRHTQVSLQHHWRLKKHFFAHKFEFAFEIEFNLMYNGWILLALVI